MGGEERTEGRNATRGATSDEKYQRKNKWRTFIFYFFISFFPSWGQPSGNCSAQLSSEDKPHRRCLHIKCSPKLPYFQSSWLTAAIHQRTGAGHLWTCRIVMHSSMCLRAWVVSKILVGLGSVENKGKRVREGRGLVISFVQPLRRERRRERDPSQRSAVQLNGRIWLKSQVSGSFQNWRMFYAPPIKF